MPEHEGIWLKLRPLKRAEKLPANGVYVITVFEPPLGGGAMLRIAIIPNPSASGETFFSYAFPTAAAYCN